MASPVIVVLAALGTGLVFTLLGSALTRWLAPAWASGRSLEPALGWSVFTALALPVQLLLGLSRVSTAGLLIAALGLAAAVLVAKRRSAPSLLPLPLWALLLAALIAAIPLAGLTPRHVGDGVIIGLASADHVKVAMIDEMTRQGLPPGNPFFAAHGARGSLSYYWLWHFGAAQLSSVTGISGWEADAALTGFTAYASMLLMMGLTGWICARFEPFATAVTPAGRGVAMAAVGILSLAGNLTPILTMGLGKARLAEVIADYRNLETWITQASWVPQHLASAGCVVMAVLFLLETLKEPRIGRTIIVGVLAAAAFGCSAWVGGVTFAAIATATGVVALVRAPRGGRRDFFLSAAGSAIIAAVLAAPLIQAEFGTLAARAGQSPVAFHPFEVVGSLQPHLLRRVLDLPAYWLVLLPMDLPAVYPAGIAAFWAYARRAWRSGGLDAMGLGLAMLVLMSFGVSWLLISTIGNNDLGWRAMLPGLMVLTPFAAAGFAFWIRARRFVALAAALALLAISFPERTAVGDITGQASDDAAAFATSPAMWADVRRFAGPADRVASNPGDLDTIAGYPVNLGWGLLSDRPSCYAHRETTRVFAPLSEEARDALDAQFERVFLGEAEPGDLKQLAQDDGCRVVVVTERDDAWNHDPFADSPYYRLALQARRWRIYVATGHTP
jgi:hypothetical protein